MTEIKRENDGPKDPTNNLAPLSADLYPADTPHSGSDTVDESMREKPVEEFGTPLGEDLLTTPDSPEALTSEMHEQFWTRGKKIGAGVLGVLTLIAGIGIAATSKGHDKVKIQAVASSMPNPGSTTATTSKSVQVTTSVSPSSVVSPGEVAYYPNQGNVNMSRILSTDKTYTVKEGGVETTLPYLRNVSDASSEVAANCANSLFSQIGRYYNANDDNVATTILHNLTQDPTVTSYLESQRAITQAYRTSKNGIGAELTVFEDTASDPAEFESTGPDAAGNSTVSLKGGTLVVKHFIGDSPDKLTGIAQNTQNVMALSFGLNKSGKLTQLTVELSPVQ